MNTENKQNKDADSELQALLLAVKTRFLSAFAASLTHQLLSKFFLSSARRFLPGLASHERGAASCGAALQRTLSVAATRTEPQKYVALVFTGVIPRLFQRVIMGVTELCSDQRTKRHVRRPGFNSWLINTNHVPSLCLRTLT